MNRVSYGHTGKSGLAVLVVTHLLLLVFTTGLLAAEPSPNQARPIIKENMKALLTGQEISQEMKQRQETVTTMIDTGTLTKKKLQEMIKEATLAVLDEAKTSRYILTALPEKVNDLMKPYLTWNEVRKTVWEACSSIIPEHETMIITIGTLAPPGTPWMSVPETLLIPEMKRLSDGKVVIKIYGGGVMGEDTDILRKMDIGQLDGCGCTALGVLKASPETSVFLLPGLFNNYDEIDYIMKKFRKRIDASFAEQGYILAAMIDTGFFHFFSKSKIDDLADIKKRKPLTWFGQVETALFDELGINATPVAVPEIVSALSTGLAETNLAPAAWMLGMQAYQYANYFVKQPLLYSPAAIIVSLDTKHRLQKQFEVSDTFAYNIQELLVFEVKSLEEEWKKRARTYERKSLEAFQQKCGMKAVTLPPEDMQAIKEAGLKVREKLAGKAFSAELLQDVEAALEDYRQNKK